MRKLLFLFVLAILPFVANAAVEINGIYYNLTTGETNTAEVTYKPSGNYSGDIVIPASVTYDDVDYSVTTIGYQAFNNCSGLTSVTIGNSVTTIGDYAFYNCTGLTSVTIPNSVTTIGKCAFRGCSVLTSVTIPNSVTTIGDYAFYNFTGLTSVTIPNSVSSIGNDAFWGCSGLTSVISEIKNPFEISDNVFDSSNDLIYSNATLIVPEGAKSAYRSTAGWKKFQNIVESTKRTIHVAKAGTLKDLISEDEKYQITELTLTGEINGTDFRLLREMSGKGYQDDHDYHYYDTDGKLGVLDLSGVKIVAGGDYYMDHVGIELMDYYYLTNDNEIPRYVFYSCYSLKSITLPNSLMAICEKAFGYCSNLTSISIPSNLTCIGRDAFKGSAWFDLQPDELIYFGKFLCGYNSTMPDNSNLTIIDGTLCITDFALYGCSKLASITIPNSVKTIGSSAFSGCTGLTSITIPSSVTTIGSAAFSGCTGLTSITIPSSVTTISGSLFYGCTGLTSISIPNSVTEIGYSAFGGCTSLTSITIPNSVTNIGDATFYGCTSLTSIPIPNSVITIGKNMFCGCSSLSVITIPNNVITINERAFCDCIGLRSVTIPNSVKTIGKYVFSGCINLTSLSVEEGNPIFDSRDNCNAIIETTSNTLLMGCKGTIIPTSVTEIGSSAFSGCKELSSIIIPNSVTSIGDNAFNGCCDLTSISIPNSVTFLGGYSFYACQKLESITISNKVSSINTGTFLFCSSLASITIPNSVNVIESSAFSQCGLQSVTIPNSVTSIGDFAFSNCQNLTSITISKSVTSIGIWAFRECSGLTDVYCYAEIVPETDLGAFSISNIANATLHVPAGSVDAYQAAEPWKQFKIIVGMSDYDEIKITSAGQTTWCSEYDLDFTEEEGLKVYTATGYKRSTGTIWLSRIKEVPAGEGILIVGDEGVYKIPHRATTAYYLNMLVGTLEAMTLNETDGEYTNYYLSNGKEGVGFYKVNGSVKLGAHRAYLPLKKGTADNANTRYIGFTFDDGATSIDPLSASDADENNAAYYNLQGQRVDNPTKGLYIKNGKKVIVR